MHHEYPKGSTIRPKPLDWDPYSDQPYKIRDKKYKRKMRLKHLFSLFQLLFVSLIMLPIAWMTMKLWRRPKVQEIQDFFGMSINYDRFPSQSLALIDELGVTSVLIRFRMSELSQIQDYKEWIEQLGDKKLMIHVIQDPTLSQAELQEAFQTLFETFAPFAALFQIGSTINRAKWGFFSVRQYLKFYHTAYKVAKKDFPDIRLLGPSVIDFEYHYTAQALFNLFPIRYDACSALLYTDRTITPENRQFGFDLIGKIDLLYALIRLSPKTSNELYITETNWPISGSGKYSPTSEKECVSEEDFANYMVRYYLLALGSGKVTAVYWHQLIAVAFGLVDPKNGELKKRSAFFAFQTMLAQLNNAKAIRLEQSDTYYELYYTTEELVRRVIWTNDTKSTIALESPCQCLSRDGEAFTAQTLSLSGKPIYILEPTS